MKMEINDDLTKAVSTCLTVIGSSKSTEDFINEAVFNSIRNTREDFVGRFEYYTRKIELMEQLQNDAKYLELYNNNQEEPDKLDNLSLLQKEVEYRQKKLDVTKKVNELYRIEIAMYEKQNEAMKTA